MKPPTCKADLHVHSRYSRRPSSWILKKIGCAESYTDPHYLYRSLKDRGMDMVTITDHNTIAGALEIAHQPDTFISEEITTYFPEDHCKLHVLAYHINERQHEEITRVRENVFDLVDFLNAEKIVHALAHPLYSINGLLTAAHFQKCLLLFKNLELNGARDHLQNTTIRRIVAGLKPETMADLADHQDVAPRGADPWKKNLISGSDDHSSLSMGRSYTQVSGPATVADFLAGIEQGRAGVQTHNGTPETLAHNIYSIMYQFYMETFQVRDWINDAALIRFLDQTLLPPDHYSAKTPPETAASGKKKKAEFTLPRHFLKNAKSAVAQTPTPGNHPAASGEVSGKDEIWLQFVNTLSDMVLRQFADDLLARLTQADLFYLFTSLGSAASLYMLLAPYFIAYSLFSRDRAFALACQQQLAAKDGEAGPPRRHIAMFTDTFSEINGVATAIQSQVAAARLTRKNLTLLTCDPHLRLAGDKVAVFEPIGAFDLPEYPELKVYYPPVLNILSYCYRAQITHIHAETPGAMGLTALAAAHILNLPLRGTYHTALPQTVRSLTGDTHLEDLLWKYMVWFYGQMKTIFSPSAMTAGELIDQGLPADKIVVHQWGVDTTAFTPDKRNGFFSRRYHLLPTDLKLLYVGRVSQEKNLGQLVEVMRRIGQKRRDVCLIIVGEGPYLEQLQRALAEWPVLFTGYLTGEDLAQAYAASDIFLFPSTVDTMGNVVVEAQASGLPVIVTDEGGPKENMIDRQTGFVVKNQEALAEGFAEAVLRLADDRELLTTMKKNARRYTRDRSVESSFLAFWDNYR